MPKKLKWFTHVEPYLEEIQIWASDERMTDEDIAYKLDISPTLFKEYKNNRNATCLKNKIDTSALLPLLKRARMKQREKIDFNLYKRAEIGSVKTTINYKSINGRRVEVSRKEEHLPPTAADVAMYYKLTDPEAREKLSNNVQIDNTNVNNAMDNFNSFSEEIAKYLPNDNED